MTSALQLRGRVTGPGDVTVVNLGPPFGFFSLILPGLRSAPPVLGLLSSHHVRGWRTLSSSLRVAPLRRPRVRRGADPCSGFEWVRSFVPQKLPLCFVRFDSGQREFTWLERRSLNNQTENNHITSVFVWLLSEKLDFWGFRPGLPSNSWWLFNSEQKMKKAQRFYCFVFCFVSLTCHLTLVCAQDLAPWPTAAVANAWRMCP